MLCLSHPYIIIIIRKLATRPLYNLFPSRTGPMKQGLCSVVLEEAQRLSDAFRLLEGYLCLPQEVNAFVRLAKRSQRFCPPLSGKGGQKR